MKKRWPIVPFAGFLIGFCGLIWNGLPGSFKLPVVVYALVIVVMAMSSLNMNGRANFPAARLLFAGAVLFVISDCAIALKKFKLADAQEVLFSLFIMATYLLGQYLIAKGAVAANKEFSYTEGQRE